MSFRNPRFIKVQQDGNTLVAAYRSANPPLVWKFDLDRNHSFALALQGEEGDWELGVTSPKEEFHPVARFLSREDAEEAFAKTQKALFTKRRNAWRTATWILVTVMVLLIFLVVLPLMTYVHKAELNKASSGQSPTSAQQPALKDGVPMPADQVLKPPPH